MSCICGGCQAWPTAQVSFPRCLLEGVRSLERARTVQIEAPTTLFLRDSWVQIPPPALYCLLISTTELEKETKYKVLEYIF